MIYEYAGFLKSFLYKPDPSVRDGLDSIVLGPEELVRWRTWDLDASKEWQNIPAHRSQTEHGVHFEGRFRDMRRIDNLGEDDPQFWVALSTIGVKDAPFPLDVEKYPVVEITYRCTSEHAHPAWGWTYRGGEQFTFLPRSSQWRTVARMIPHFGFPKTIDRFIIRLFTTRRGTESMEIESLRFREMSPAEKDACRKNATRIDAYRELQHFDVLDEFLPMGTYISAPAARRLAELMDLSFDEYWSFVLEDLVLHSHNCVVLQQLQELSQDEWRRLLQLGERYAIRFVGQLDFPLNAPPLQQHEVVETYISPFTKSKALLAWCLAHEPSEAQFNDLLQAKNTVEQADPAHPVALLTLRPNSFALFAPFFSVSGIGYSGSHSPWQVSDLIQAHLPLSKGQQYWHVAQAFTYGSNAPSWSSCPEMRLMINLAFANGVKGWFSYLYHNDPIWVSGSLQRSLTGPFLNFSDLWLELDQRMMRYDAYAPLLLRSRPDEPLKKWFVTRCAAHANAQLAEGLPPVSLHRLRGDDFSLYSAVSNDVREMATVHINIPPTAMRGLEIYDISDFLQTREWAPMDRKRHLEMFPGQAHTMLVAKPEICDYWRDVMARRIIESDRRKLELSLEIARVYNLDAAPIEELVRSASRNNGLSNLHVMTQAHDMMLDLLYAASDFAEPRSKLVEAAAAICGCDGTLCRLIGRGRADQARELGEEVVPLAREIVHGRLALHAGQGKDILKQSESISRRALKLLERIRATV